MEKITAYLLIWLALCCVFVHAYPPYHVPDSSEKQELYSSLEYCESGCKDFCYDERRHWKCTRLYFLGYECKCTSQIKDFVETTTSESKEYW
jgi:hypothetical protein